MSFLPTSLGSWDVQSGVLALFTAAFAVAVGIVLIQAGRRETVGARSPLGRFETQVIWTLVPAFLLALFLSSSVRVPPASKYASRQDDSLLTKKPFRVVFE